MKTRVYLPILATSNSQCLRNLVIELRHSNSTCCCPMLVDSQCSFANFSCFCTSLLELRHDLIVTRWLVWLHHLEGILLEVLFHLHLVTITHVISVGEEVRLSLSSNEVVSVDDWLQWIIISLGNPF